MSIRIEFETDGLSQNEAKGLAALLATLHSDVLPVSVINGTDTPANTTAAVAPFVAAHSEPTAGPVTVTVGTPPPPVEPAPVMDPAVAFGTPTVPLESPGAGGATAPAMSTAAPPPTPLATPAPPVATSSPSNGGVIATDRNGFPWDARIHSTPAKLNAGDGLWRAKRGVSNALQTQVEAELRQTMAAPPPAPPVVSTPATSASVTDASGASVVPPVPSPPVSAPPTPAFTPEAIAAAQAQALADASAPAPPSPAQQFANLMRKVTPAQTAGKLTVVDIGNVCSGLQIPSISALMTRPDLIASAEEMIDAMIAAAA